MHYLKFDTETFQFQPGEMAPRLVCVQWQWDAHTTFLRRAAGDTLIFDASWGHVTSDSKICNVESMFREWLTRDDVTMIGHTLDYDMAVVCANFPALVPLVFEKYEKGLCHCTMVRQQLIDIATGKFRGEFSGGIWRSNNYTLDDLYRRLCGKSLDKPKTLQAADGRNFADPKHVRTRYGELIDTPIAQWPEEFVSYAFEDAIATGAVWERQQPDETWMPDHAVQAYTAFVMRLISNWGVLTDGEGVNILEAHSLEKVAEAIEVLAPRGIVKQKAGKWVRDMAAARDAMVEACRKCGKEVPATKKGAVALDKDACGALDDEVIQAYAVYSSESYVLSNEIPMLREGVGTPIHCRYSIAKSGRQLASKPNVQNRSKRKGAREAFVPAPGMLFIDADYVGLELHTLAQLCIDLFGQSRLGDVLNSGQDAHTAAAADMMGISYEEGITRKGANDPEFGRYRDFWKVAHFGIPGGLGVSALVDYAWSNYKIRLGVTPAEGLRVGKDLKDRYLMRYPEVRRLFEMVRKIVDSNGFFVLPRSKRVLKAEFFTKTANNGFQGGGADAATSGTRLVVKRCYVNDGSPLFGARPVVFAHDEVLAEVPDDDTLTERLDALCATMREGADRYLPDVRTRVDGAAMRVWSKKAKRVERGGRVIPWEWTNR